VTSYEEDLVDLALAAKSFLLLVSKSNAEKLHDVLSRPSVVKAVLMREQQNEQPGRTD